ncbi:hypothetical protein MPLSOD_250025 [Mesorhizobium sp. SOD10]|nr:hypothetical protein MPLSOD_250025 [Mesorhizobium sp. SOD10]
MQHPSGRSRAGQDDGWSVAPADQRDLQGQRRRQADERPRSLWQGRSLGLSGRRLWRLRRLCAGEAPRALSHGHVAGRPFDHRRAQAGRRRPLRADGAHRQGRLCARQFDRQGQSLGRDRLPLPQAPGDRQHRTLGLDPRRPGGARRLGAVGRANLGFVILGRSKERSDAAKTLESIPLPIGVTAVQDDLWSAPLLPFARGHGMDPRVYAPLRVASPVDDERKGLPKKSHNSMNHSRSAGDTQP